jgi:pimeloyl-ACP methyl ester carboxylesterase
MKRLVLLLVAASFAAGTIGLDASTFALRAPAHEQAPAPPQPATAPAAAPNNYGDDAAWLCRPGRKGDACDVDLTTTIVAADGTLTRETFAADPKAPIDCFYVYPTVSADPTPMSDMSQDPAEKNVVLQQFARFASKCRPFAPMYRQITLRGLQTALATNADPLTLFSTGLQYDDVRDAWQHYLKNDNQGRGVVLVGHSQGAFILQALIANEIDGKPIQKQLVGAYILGATFLTPKGKDVGGQFKQIPLCKKSGQVGCVVNYSAFRSTVTPPANTLFGKSADPALSGNCTNPAALGTGSAPLRAYLSAGGRMIAMGGAPPKPWATDKTIDTPFVSVPGLLTAECKSNEFATYLEIKVNGDPADPRVDDIGGDLGAAAKPIAQWGLHLVDVNLAMGNLLDLVEAQSKAYRSRR